MRHQSAPRQDSRRRRRTGDGATAPMVTDAMLRIPVEDLSGFSIQLLTHHGMSHEHAAVMTANLMEADMRGIKTHGHWHLARYCGLMRDGMINATPNLTVPRDSGATLVVDGDRAHGHVAGHFTMQAVIRRARELGTAVGLTRNSMHYGASAHFAIMALEHDMIGYAATNAGPSMFPFGGRDLVMGNNPIAYAIPAGREHPLVLDMAMSMSANSRVSIMGRLGQPVPAGWILDEYGQPTTDASALDRGGAGVSIGGPKGIGLAQVVDALAGVLAGTAFGPDVFRPDKDGQLGPTGHIFHAIDIAPFMPVQEFKDRMDEQIRLLHEATRVEGVERIFVPGEMEWESFAEANLKGVPLLEVVVNDLNSLAVQVGMQQRL